MTEPVPFSPLSRRRSSTIPLPVSTSIDPRLQTQPRHTLGPWLLSRTVSNSSSGSSNTSGIRSRAGSSASRYNDPLSPDRANPLERIQEILEMQMNMTYDKLARRGSGESTTEAEDEGDSMSKATGIFTNESQDPANNQESGPDKNNEQALKREIFSIHDALTNSHDDTTLSYFPQTTNTPLHIDLSLSHFQQKALGTVQSRNANSVTLTLTLSLSDSPQGSRQHKPAIPFSFSHLRAGDTVTLVNDLAHRNTNTSTNASATQQQHQYINEKTTTTITGQIPPRSYHTATTTRATARELSINSKSFCLNTSIPLYIYVLSLMLMLAFPPTTYFFLHYLTSTSSSTSSPSPLPSTITFIFMTLLTLNAFIIGVIFWIRGTCLVLLMRLRESPRWKSGGEREKREGVEIGEKEQMTKIKDAVYRLFRIKYEAELEYESEFEPEAISPTMNWIFGAVIAGIWCVSWYVPWVMSMMEWAEY